MSDIQKIKSLSFDDEYAMTFKKPLYQVSSTVSIPNSADMPPETPHLLILSNRTPCSAGVLPCRACPSLTSTGSQVALPR